MKNNHANASYFKKKVYLCSVYVLANKYDINY